MAETSRMVRGCDLRVPQCASRMRDRDGDLPLASAGCRIRLQCARLRL